MYKRQGKYTPENMLISNGIHYANSKKQSKELRTSSPVSYTHLQERDSICPPTRWVATAAGPKSDTILVRIMEIPE